MLDHHQLFPTSIFTKENFLDIELYKSLHDGVEIDKAHINNKDLNSKIIEVINELLESQDIKDYTPEITEIWGNVSLKGQDHPVHTHPNNVFSGIIYLTPGVGTNFVDANPAKGMILLNNNNSIFNNSATLAAIPNMIVIFPSWLPHYVPVNQEVSVRKTISFNIILRGEYGGGKSLAKVTI